MHPTPLIASLVAALSLSISACGDPATQPEGMGPGVSAAAVQPIGDPASYCLPNPDRIVTTLDELADANEESGPGTRIAIQGMIAIEAGFTMRYDNMVLTCASPGSGLSAVPGADVWALIQLRARSDTVSGLVLDARESHPHAVYATIEEGLPSLARDPVIQGNTMTCSVGPCIWVAADNFAQGKGGHIADNTITVLGTGADIAIQVQGWSDARLERNRLVTTAPADVSILLNGDTRISVMNNEMSGDWSQGFAAVDHTTASELRSNHLWGTLDPFVFVDVDSMLVEGNDILCGSRTCGYVHIGPRTTLRGNRVLSHGSQSGLRIQRWTDGSIIEDNVLILDAPPSPLDTAGIRAHGGTGVIIRRNRIAGPWVNGILVLYLEAPTVDQNEVSGAMGFAALFFGDRGSFTGNRLSGGSEAALGVGFGCYNTFRGNMLRPAADAPAAFFDVLTGANRYQGAGTTVVDNGDFDCDDQNGVDPNLITGDQVPGHSVAVSGSQIEAGSPPR